jgi:hypothetical protein
MQTHLLPKLEFVRCRLTLIGGITGGYSDDTDGYTYSVSRSVTLGENECGYFTFIPIKRETCGTRTSAQLQNLKSNDRRDCVNDVHTWANVCAEDQQFWPRLNWPDWLDGLPTWMKPEAVMRGETVLVRTSCSDRRRLPLDRQDEAYRHPGVALDQGLCQSLSEAWVKQEAITPQASDTICGNAPGVGQQPSAFRTDCDHIMADLFATPGVVIPVKKGDVGLIQQQGNCRIEVVYGKTYGDGCKVTHAEVGLAALKLSEKCTNMDNGSIGGSRRIRTGDCGAQVGIRGKI